MGKTKIFSEFEIISEAQFNAIIEKDNDDLWDITNTMIDMNQIISPLYFSDLNHYFKPKDLALGVVIGMASTFDRLLILYVESDSIFIDRRNINNNQYVLLAEIYREDIISYSKEGDMQFQGVRPKVVNKVINDQSAFPAGGILVRTLFMGTVKLAHKLEKDFREREGVLYKLSFNYEGRVITEYIICDKLYETDFDDFLSDGWTNVKPVRPEIVEQPEEIESKEGCFIATACYGSYEAPSVLVLRNYRDQFLSKNKIGRLFIKTYYFFSPKLALIISKCKTLKYLVRFLLITPIVKLLPEKFKNNSEIK
ncbi:MAG TPA: hypothetical protein PLY69_07370 [Bacteroidales bacterium]|nr:hypothetical protein [Bacteroidales bacterium]